MKINNVKRQNKDNLYLAREVVLKNYPVLEGIRLVGKERTDKQEFYKKTASEIVRKMGLPTNWASFIYLYFLRNSLKVTADKIGVRFDNENKEVVINISADTTKKDYIKAWDEVQKLQLLVKLKRKPLKIGYIAYEATFKNLYNGKKPVKIAIEMEANEKYIDYFESTEYENIRQLISRTKKILKL